MSNFGYLQRQDGVAGGDVCFADTGVRVETVASRFVAGESLADLAEDYAIPLQTIEAGVRLILLAKGTSLESRRAVKKVAQHIPLLSRRA